MGRACLRVAAAAQGAGTAAPARAAAGGPRAAQGRGAPARATAAAALALLLALASAAAATSVAGQSPTPPPERAIWVWEEDAFRLLDDESYRRATMDFLARQGIATLYLYADEHAGRNILVHEPERYRRLLAALHARGFRVYALLGSAPLHTEEYVLPEKREAAVRMLGNVLAFHAGGDPATRFDGVNVDVEPYLLDDWREQRDLRARQYLDLGAEYMRMKRAAGATIPVGPAMPFWFDGIAIEWNGATRRLSEHTQDLYDYVAIMDYRNFADGPDGIVAHGRDEIDHADAAGRKVVIGVETLDTTPPKVTFFGKGAAAMEAELALVERAFRGRPSFAGFAIHHLASYRALVAEPAPPPAAPSPHPPEATGPPKM